MPVHRNTPPPSALSRRRLLAAAGAAGAAAATVGVAGVADAAVTGASTQDGPVVVHLRDLASGTLDVYAGTSHRQIRDRDLAARIARATRKPAAASLDSDATRKPTASLAPLDSDAINRL